MKSPHHQVPLLAKRISVCAVALALLLSSTGCATPYVFSNRLDTRLQPASSPVEAERKGALAGDLHLSLEALMDQRRLFWLEAGQIEQMKNATALGLIGLGAAGLYRGLQGDSSSGWLKRAGLLSAATYAGASWFEPSERQKIYLQGALSLTCLSLATAPYEMSKDDYIKLKEDIADSRAGVEALASAVRMVGAYSPYSDTWWLVRGGWNKLRWASKVLDSADVAMGNLEKAGPRLRDMSAMTASEVATQVNRISKDLSQVTDAIAKLKPNANLLIGSVVFPPEPKDQADEDAPVAGGAGPNSEKEAGKESASKDAQCSASAPVPTPTPESTPAPALAPELAKAVKQATAAAAAASAAAGLAKRDASRSAGSANKAAEAAKLAVAAATSAASAAEAMAKLKTDEERTRDALIARLRAASDKIDKSLGSVISFVQRVAQAQRADALPAACGSAAVTLVPAKDSIVLQPGERFQFLLQGDSGRASAEILGMGLPGDLLDLSMPLSQSSSIVRITASQQAPKTVVNTVVRISDSKGQQNFDIAVKLCPKPS